jgi:hypothetical protein
MACHGYLLHCELTNNTSRRLCYSHIGGLAAPGLRSTQYVVLLETYEMTSFLFVISLALQDVI